MKTANANFDLLLAQVRRHIALDAREAEYFASLWRVRTLKKRQFLVQAGDVCRYDSFVTKGCLKTSYTDTQTGHEHIVAFAVEDWWTGDFGSFVSGEPAIYDVEALEDCELLQIDYPTLEELYQKIPKFERFFRLIFQRYFLALERRIVLSISQTAEERYLDFVKRHPQIYQRVPQYLVASYLGITPEFLSKIRSQLSHRPE